MEKCSKWCDCVGLKDPMVVVRYCVSLLSRDVYPNMSWTKFDLECSKAKPGEPCEGIKLYLENLEEDPVIVQEVKYFIKHPCKDEMKRVINSSSTRALQFMLEYLKLRGPFILWKVDNNVGSTNSISKTRCVIRYATSYLESLPEQDFCACVCLGRYLHYVLSISYAHEMFFMKEILSKIYGPIFIEIIVCKELQAKIPPKKCIEYAVLIFKSMLETCPWYQYSPTESVNKSLYPTAEREFSHKYEELADYIYNKMTLPKNLQNNLGEMMYQSKMLSPGECVRDANLRTESRCFLPLSEEEEKYSPDKCRINFDQFSAATDKIFA